VRQFVALLTAAIVAGCSGDQPPASISATQLVPSVAPVAASMSPLPSATNLAPLDSPGPLAVDRLPSTGWIVFSAEVNRVQTLVRVAPNGLELGDLLPGSQPAWSPDGQLLAFSCVTDPRAEPATLGICMSRPDGSGKTTFIRDGHSPQYSPDGARISYLRGIIDAAEVFVTDARTGRDGQMVGRSISVLWSPDSERLLLHDIGGLSIVGRAGDVVQPIGGYAGAWSPDGGKVAFFRVVGTVAHLLLADVTSGSITPTGFATESALEGIVWLAPDRLVFLMDGDLWRMDLTRPTEPVQLTTGLAIDWPTLSLSPDLHWVAFTKTSGEDAGLYVASVDGGWALIVEATQLRDPTWQPAP
jgi:dipeptidyl aminopeptidase/acylaminoacyl peptidase